MFMSDPHNKRIIPAGRARRLPTFKSYLRRVDQAFSPKAGGSPEMKSVFIYACSPLKLYLSI